MDPTNSRPYPAAFKATVALAALRHEQTLEELAARYSVPEQLIQDWARSLEQGAESVFATDLPEGLSNPDFLESGELARTIAENSTQGFAMMSREGFCIYANRAWLDMTGYTSAEIGAKPLHYLVHHHRPDGSPYPMEECPIDRALPENFNVRAHTDLFFRKDGSTFEVACAASPIFHNGEPVATVIEIRDVTEQNLQARRILESEQKALFLAASAEEQQRRLNTFLDAAPVGIVICEANGKVILVNHANQDLWGHKFIMAESTVDYREFKGWWADGASHHGHPVQPEEWAMARALRGEIVDNDIVEIQPFDYPDVRRIITIAARPIRDAIGVITGGVVAQMDITQQKKAEDALREADRNKDNFLAMLAHELRNPLAPIRTALDLFAMRCVEDPLMNQAAGVMNRQVDHMIRLVDDLLDVARISRGKVELKTELLDLSEIIEQTVEDYRPSIDSKGITLDVLLPPRAVWVKGDKARILQIFSNLLHNAAKFTKRGRRIAVSLDEKADAGLNYAVVHVEDEGAGIAPDLMQTLFSPFVQGDQGLGRKEGGLGLGLALAKGLTELHGGKVTAASAGEGEGARFTVCLPVCEPDAAISKTRQPLVSRHGLKIVAIDDNVDALEMLSQLLQIQGHEVTLAYDARTGLELVRNLQPDVVLCDIGLPDGLSGYDVAEKIRSDPAVADVMLVAISGYGQTSDKRDAFSAGFNAHLVKPVGNEELVELLKNVKARTPTSRNAR